MANVARRIIVINEQTSLVNGNHLPATFPSSTSVPLAGALIPLVVTKCKISTSDEVFPNRQAVPPATVSLSILPAAVTTAPPCLTNANVFIPCVLSHILPFLSKTKSSMRMLRSKTLTGPVAFPSASILIRQNSLKSVLLQQR